MITLFSYKALECLSQFVADADGLNACSYTLKVVFDFGTTTSYNIWGDIRTQKGRFFASLCFGVAGELFIPVYADLSDFLQSTGQTNLCFKRVGTHSTVLTQDEVFFIIIVVVRATCKVRT